MKKEVPTVAESIRDFLFWVLRISAGMYVLFIGGFMPFYYHKETNYTTIGTAKAQFFMNWGYNVAKVALLALLFFTVFGIVCLIQKEKKSKGYVGKTVSKVLHDLTITDRFVILYMLALTISYILSPFKEFAIQGATGWFMGYVPQMTFAGFYFLISKTFSEKMAKISLGFLLFISGGVFVLGILNRYGVNPLGMKSSGPSFISTIGNINWYGGYYAVYCGISMVFFVFLEHKKWWNELLRGLFFLFGITAYVTGVTQGSDGGVFVTAAVILLLGLLSMKKMENMRRYLLLLLGFCGTTIVLHFVQRFHPEANHYITDSYKILIMGYLSFVGAFVFALLYVLMWVKPVRKTVHKIINGCIMVVTVVSLIAIPVLAFLIMQNTKNPGSIGKLSEYAVFTFNAEWGSSRGATWQSGVETIRSLSPLHKMFGIGPDSMAAQIYQGNNEALTELVRGFFGNSRLTNAHNEWLTILVNTGVFGLTSWAVMIVGSILTFVGQKRSLVARACGVAVLCYTLYNIFSFQTMNNITQMYLLLGLGAACIREKEKENAL